MGRLPTNDDDAFERAVQAVATAHDVSRLREAQAFLLPLLGLSLEQSAKALGRSKTWVSRTRIRFLRGECDSPVPKRHVGRGGRRNQLLSEAEELLTVKRAVTIYGNSKARSVRDALRGLLLDTAGTDPAESTVSAMLNRNAPLLLAGATPWELQGLAHFLTQMWSAEEMIAAHRPTR